MDLKSYSRWYDYSRARDAMFAATDTSWAPWFVAHTDDKKRGRLNIISHLLSQIPYEPLAPRDVTAAQAAEGRRLRRAGPAIAIHPHAVLAKRITTALRAQRPANPDAVNPPAHSSHMAAESVHARSRLSAHASWHHHVVTDRQWLSGWNARYARVLAEAETPDARAALVDTNGDGRELWFGLEAQSPFGEWVAVLDWGDVGEHHPRERAYDLDVIFGWGTGQARKSNVVDYDGDSFPIRAGRNGSWLLLTSASPTAA